MDIVRMDPFRGFLTLRGKMNRFFEDDLLPGNGEDVVSRSWSPSVDIYEDENALFLSAELPGIDEDSIEIKIEDSTLSLKGERKFEKETKKENYFRIERSYGSFCRSFSLPNYVDHEKIKAENENGLLKITIPKKPELKPRNVKIIKSSKPKK